TDSSNRRGCLRSLFFFSKTIFFTVFNGWGPHQQDPLQSLDYVAHDRPNETNKRCVFLANRRSRVSFNGHTTISYGMARQKIESASFF
ncbi:hypothetical protein PJI17_31840, partial [Mycobacterium kansasii]